MPSYKKHVLFSILMTLPFFPDVFYLSIAILGASMLDMDHDVNRKNLTIMALIGMVIVLTLYILKLPFLIGLILIILALIFYVSKHRGFMRAYYAIYLRPKPDDLEIKNEKIPRVTLIAMAVFLIICIVFGLFPGLATNSLQGLAVSIA